MFIDEIHSKNKKFLNTILAQPDLRIYLHYNAHWFGQSIIVDDIFSYLISKNSESDPFGFVTFGVKYEDEYFQHKVGHSGEIYHIVIKPEYQHMGYGEKIIKWVEEKLYNTGYCDVFIAYAVENKIAGNFYKKFDFIDAGHNYDGDIYVKKNLRNIS